MKLLKRLTLALGILMCVVSIGIGAMSNDELQRAIHNCYENNDKSACEALIYNGLESVEQCDRDTCFVAGSVYTQAGYYKEAIPYYEKAISLGDNSGYGLLGYIYTALQDYFNAQKYCKMACDKGDKVSCYNLGLIVL